MRRNESGFTLVELIVTIAIGSLVTLAATTVLLLGLRINNRSTQTVTRQNTARVVITMLENLAAEGEIVGIETDGDTSWRISNAQDVILASYDAETKTIYSSHSRNKLDDSNATSATPLLEDVSASAISLNKSGLLSISVTTDDITYESSIYCRTMRTPDDEEASDQADQAVSGGKEQAEDATVGKEGRLAFLNVLASQYRLKGGSPNPGLILEDKYSTGMYYTQWYLGGTYKDGWDIETPWCACFVSWGLCYPGKDSDNDGVLENRVVQYINPDTDNRAEGGVAFANVDFFCEYFKNLHQEASGENPEKVHWKDAYKNGAYAIPTPGDIIFIDWDGNRDDPAHVGVVLKVETKTVGDKTVPDSVYTIEGNRENRVMVCKYALDDPIIMGYGIIDWKS